MSLRDTILATDDLPKKKIKIPEWGVELFVASMSSGDREIWEKTAKEVKDVRETIVILTVVDDEGKKVFTADDIPALKKKNAKALDRIAMAAIEHNKITADDIDELEKN